MKDLSKEETFCQMMIRMEEELKDFQNFKRDFSKCLLGLHDKYPQSSSYVTVDLRFDESWKDFTIRLLDGVAFVLELDLKSVLRIVKKEEKN